MTKSLVATLYIFTFYDFSKSIWRSIYYTNLIASFTKKVEKYSKREEQFTTKIPWIDYRLLNLLKWERSTFYQSNRKKAFHVFGEPFPAIFPSYFAACTFSEGWSTYSLPSFYVFLPNHLSFVIIAFRISQMPWKKLGRKDDGDCSGTDLKKWICLSWMRWAMCL